MVVVAALGELCPVVVAVSGPLWVLLLAGVVSAVSGPLWVLLLAGVVAAAVLSLLLSDPVVWSWLLPRSSSVRLLTCRSRERVERSST